MSITITQLYDLLSEKLGKDTAENLTGYIGARIEQEVEVQSNNLAGKSDILELKNDISVLIAELKNDISEVRAELKNDISEARAELKNDISGVRAELKNDISEARAELKIDIAKSETELIGRISKSKIDMIKWTVGLFVVIVVLILGLYFK